MLEGKGYGHDLHSSYVFHDVFVHPAEGSAFQKNNLPNAFTGRCQHGLCFVLQLQRYHSDVPKALMCVELSLCHLETFAMHFLTLWTHLVTLLVTHPHPANRNHDLTKPSMKHEII